ncbi:MAG: DUF58 domain-containing protein [Myxococcota bacterium]|nr:DUF58 domain-containing protein [Myxococcota bacterium]
MRADLARLNHVLLPATKSGRDRYRNGRIARRLRHITWIFARLTWEGRILLAAVFAAMLFAANIVRTQSHVLVLITGSLLFASLSFTRAYRLKGVTAELRSPARVTVGDEITIHVSLRNEGNTAHRALRIEQPLLPWDGSWAAPQSMIASLAPGGRASAQARARFVARGEHHMDPFRVVALLPLGLSQGAPVRTEGLRFVVVPRVARVTSIVTPRNRRHQPGGVARASRTGDATDLLGVRPYRPGDPVRDLHARLWARHGVPVVREYQEEYFARIGVGVDSDTRFATPSHLEAALSLAAGVIATLCRSEALVDLLVMGESLQRLSLGRSLGSLDQALDVLAAVQPGHAFSADSVLAQLGPHLEQLSSVVLIFLSWNAARAALASAIRARGVGCAVLIVGDHASREPYGTTVPLDSIVNGEELSL